MILAAKAFAVLHPAVILVSLTLLVPAFSEAEGIAPLTLPEIQQQLADGQPTKIVCFGDSITGVYYHTGGSRAWCDMLGIVLKQAYAKADLQMINAGMSGHTTANALARIEGDVIAKKPQLVVVMFGMNDVVRVPLETYGKNMREIIRRCRQAGAAVVLCTPNAVSETAARPQTKLANYVDAVRTIAVEEKLPLVDCFAAWQAHRSEDRLSWSLMMSDEIHPNMTGHLRFAELMGSVICGRPLTFDETPEPSQTLDNVFDRLANKETVKLVAAAPYDKLVPELLRHHFPDAKLEVIVWPVQEQTIADASAWAKRIRQLQPQLVIPTIPPAASKASQAAFIHDFQWVLNFSLPFSGRAWGVVPILPLETQHESDTQKQYADLASQIILGKDLLFIERQADDLRSPSEIVGSWIDTQQQNWQATRAASKPAK